MEKKGVIEADCFESHESCETQEDEREMGNVCDAQTEAGMLLLIIHSVRAPMSTKETSDS